jgi:Domain of unknown function (DUF4251)
MKKAISLVTAIIFFACHQSIAQATEKEQKEAAMTAAVKKMIESKHYMFVPQTMLPQSGRARPVTTPYDLRVIQDTISADLPYIGRAYSSDYGSTDNSINFKTTSFQYDQQDGKKGGWRITITPKSIRNVSKFFLDVSTSGFTSLVVSSNTRQQISYNGYIQELK